MRLTAKDIEDFYSKYVSFDGATRITRRDGAVELTTKCPFHNDDHPSLSINLSNGLYKCHAASCPQCTGGNIYQFYSAIHECDVSAAREVIYATYKKETKKYRDFPITEDNINAWHVALLGNETVLKWIRTNCRWTDETLEKYELGWNGVSITIPIRHDGQLINVRRYTPKAKVNKVQGVQGFNTATLWPQENLDAQTIYIFEGEKDCMLACQLGLTAVTSTGGSGSFFDDWVKYFVNKDVVVCYDIDKAGIDGAAKVASVISGCVSSLKIIKLPITVPENGDFTDYILQKNSIQDFQKLVDETPNIVVKQPTSVAVSPDVVPSTLENASYGCEFFKRLRVKVRILGKDLAPYLIPRTIVVTCNGGRKPKCVGCGVNKNNLKTTIELNEEIPETIAFLNCTAAQQKTALKLLARISGQCNTFDVTYTEHQFVEEVTAIPYIDEQSFDEEYLRRTMYVLNQKLEANRDYELELITIPDPRTQYLIHVVYKSRPCETSIEEFKMTPELFEKLRIFQCQPNLLEESSSASTTTSPQM